MEHFNEVINHKLTISSGKVFSKAKDFAMENYGVIFGYMICAFIMFFFLGVIETTLASLPALVMVVWSVLKSGFQNSVYAGVFIFGSKEKLKRRPVFSDFFGGIKSFTQLLILTLIQVLAFLISFVPMLLFFGTYMLSMFGLADSDPNEMIKFQQEIAEFSITFIAAIVLTFVLMLLVLMFMFYSVGLVAVYKLSAIKALELSVKKVKENLGFHIKIFLLMFVFGLITALLFGLFVSKANPFAGMFVFGFLGIFFMFPFFIAFQATMFNEVCVYDPKKVKEEMNYEDLDLLDA